MVTTYPISTPSFGLGAIAADAIGRYWFTTQGVETLSIFKPPATTTQMTLEGFPLDVIQGQGRTMWVAFGTSTSGAILRISY